jgi:hypothetical protein
MVVGSFPFFDPSQHDSERASTVTKCPFAAPQTLRDRGDTLA